MAQFDVYKNLSENNTELYPYLLDVQHDLHTRMDTRIIVPLSQKLSSAEGLRPEFTVNGEPYVAVVADIVGLPASLLGKKVDNISKDSSKIMDAIDLLFWGFR